MHPSIISIGPLTIRSYGLMLAIGMLSGILLTAWRAKKAGEDPDHIFNLAVWVVISSLFGARLYYVLTHYHEFSAPGEPIVNRIFIEMRNMFWPVGSDGNIGINGLVLYGGLILATLATIYYLRKHKLNIPMYLDFIAPALGIGLFFTRIGCYLNGCCFGVPTESSFGVVFPEHSAPHYHFGEHAIHPAQLYSSFAGLIILVTILWLDRHKKFNGFSALLFFMLYSVARFILDMFRYYEEQLTWFGLSHNQILSIIIFAAAGAAMIYFTYKANGNKLGKSSTAN